MQRGKGNEPVDERVAGRQRHLRECALLLIGAMSEGGSLPGDVAGVETLIEQTAEPEPVPGHRRFAAESADELPRFAGRGLVWISPVGDGILRLRAEGTLSLTWTSVLLHADGRLTSFTTGEGFGVPDSKLTPQAKRDLEDLASLQRQADAEAAESEARFELEHRRFSAEHLIDVKSAPWQDPTGVVVTWLALYDSGVIVHYFVPRPSDHELASSDADDHMLLDASHPRLELRDSVGTEYSPVGVGQQDLTGPLLRASREFIPAVPGGASHLIVRSDPGSVEIEVSH